MDLFRLTGDTVVFCYMLEVNMIPLVIIEEYNVVSAANSRLRQRFSGFDCQLFPEKATATLFYRSLVKL